LSKYQQCPMEKAAYSLHAALVPIERAHVVDIKANANIDAAEALTVGAPVLHRKMAI
jgi:hypothetical protein